MAIAELISRRLFLGGSVATLVSAALIKPPMALILPEKPEVILDWLPCDGRAVRKDEYPELWEASITEYEEGHWEYVGHRLEWIGTGRLVHGRPALRHNGEYFYVPGIAVDRLRRFQPDIERELSHVDFVMATRQVKLPSGLIVLPGTLMPKTV